MNTRIRLAAVLLILVLALGGAGVRAADYTPGVKLHTYPNGLTLMVVERHDWPTVACYRYHKVGSVNERPGLTGAAHLLEHMMFKGTSEIGTWNYEAEVPLMSQIEKIVDEIEKERAKGLSGYQKMDQARIDRLWKQVKALQDKQRQYIRKNEVDYIYHSQGGDQGNASTGYDRTDYYVSLPANRVEVWTYVESERMRAPVFREFYSERDVVNEERRMYANSPDGALYEVLFDNLFVTMPYSHDIVGWASDLESMRSRDVMAFLKKYYAPNNTIIVLVGDLKFQDAKELVGKYFGTLPRQPDPGPVFTKDAPQKGERRVELEFDAKPRVLIGYHGPIPGHPDQYALDVLSYVLTEGRTSRFYKNLVEKNLAYSCNGGNWTLGYTNVFVIDAVPKAPCTPAQLEEAVYKEISLLATEPVTQREMEMVMNKVDKNYLDSLKSKMRLASSLARAHSWTGDWRNFDERAPMKKVTPQDVMRVAKKYLVKSNRTVTVLVPTPRKADGVDEDSKAEGGDEK
jgi:predicted Zn-dependent peptidase